MGEVSPSPAFSWVHTATLGAVCTHTEYAGSQLLFRRVELYLSLRSKRNSLIARNYYLGAACPQTPRGQKGKEITPYLILMISLQIF